MRTQHNRFASLKLERLEDRITPTHIFATGYPGSPYTNGYGDFISFGGVYTPTAPYILTESGAQRQVQLDPLTMTSEPSLSFKEALKTYENLGWRYTIQNGVPQGLALTIKTYVARASSTSSITPHTGPNGTPAADRMAGAFIDIATNYVPQEGQTARWIQVVTTNSKTENTFGQVQTFVDVAPNAADPFYFASDLDQRGFRDPTRQAGAALAKAVTWSAELYFVIQTQPQQFVIFPQGLKWGYSFHDRSPAQYAGLAVSSSQNPVANFGKVDITATLQPLDVSYATPPTGNVVFVNDTRNLYLGQAQLEVDLSLPPTNPARIKATLKDVLFSDLFAATLAIDRVRATYDGDLTFSASTATYDQEITVKKNCQLNLNSSAIQVTVNTPITFTATVTATDTGAATPSGIVEFYDGTTFLGSALLDSSGTASLTTSLSEGLHTVTANYLGNSIFESASDSTDVTVTGPSIRGRAWWDVDHDGIRGSFEVPFVGIGVSLLDASGIVLDSRTTDSNGEYSFATVAAGTYQLRFDPPAGFRRTIAFAGTDPSLDSDADQTTGLSAQFTITTGGSAQEFDCGAFAESPVDANPDTSTTPIDTTVSIDVLANDATAVVIINVTQPLHGTATILDNGTSDPSDDVIVYTPDVNFVGSDSFTYEVSDGFGGTAIGTVTVIVEEADPQRFAGEEVIAGADVQTLTPETLASLVQEAIRRWTVLSTDDATSALLSRVEVRIADLNGATLGLAGANANTIWLDINAAGHGWFIDATPDDDAEFTDRVASNEARAIFAEAAHRVDLLAVICHEMGHILGLEDLDTNLSPHELMTGTLGLGTRRFAAGYTLPLVSAQTEQRSDLLMQTLTLAPSTRAAEPPPDSPAEDAIWLLPQGQTSFAFNASQPAILLLPVVEYQLVQDEFTLSSSQAGGAKRFLWLVKATRSSSAKTAAICSLVALPPIRSLLAVGLRCSKPLRETQRGISQPDAQARGISRTLACASGCDFASSASLREPPLHGVSRRRAARLYSNLGGDPSFHCDGCAV